MYSFMHLSSSSIDIVIVLFCYVHSVLKFDNRLSWQFKSVFSLEAHLFSITKAFFELKVYTMEGMEEKDLTTPNCSDALAFQTLRLVSSLPDIT